MAPESLGLLAVMGVSMSILRGRSKDKHNDSG